MNDLLALASRVEAATGPDRVLDLAIWHGCMGGLPGEFPASPLEHRYTASLDAAMTLVPGGYHWTANYHAADHEGRASVISQRASNPHTSFAATPALALCAAALRARSNSLSQGSDDRG